jgi:hypothetical protein
VKKAKKITKRASQPVTGSVDAAWLRYVESAIARHSSAPFKSGPFKGHSTTNTTAWVTELMYALQDQRKQMAGKKTYDENMAMAADLGFTLVAWYANVQRAKSLDPNRPVKLRQEAQKRRASFLSNLNNAINNDELMVSVWGGQQYNLPYGKFAKGGSFV